MSVVSDSVILFQYLWIECATCSWALNYFRFVEILTHFYAHLTIKCTHHCLMVTVLRFFTEQQQQQQQQQQKRLIPAGITNIVE